MCVCLCVYISLIIILHVVLSQTLQQYTGKQLYSSYVKSALKAICYGTIRTVLGSSTLKLNPLRVNKCHCVMRT